MFSRNRNYWKDGQGTSSDTEETDDEHSHCRNCFQLKCQRKNQPLHGACPFTPCPLHCGAIYHSCKADEHRKLCGSEIVPCINSAYGCPRTMRRSECGRHLATCPASVVYCTMEWNRWPLFSKERQDRVPFVPRNHAKSGQLDAALAMRDQRILYTAMKAPSRLCRSLRNRLTERFPAVPLTNGNSLFMETVESSRRLEGTVSDEGQSSCAVSNVEDDEVNLSQSADGKEFRRDLNGVESVIKNSEDVVEEAQMGADYFEKNETRVENYIDVGVGDGHEKEEDWQFSVQSDVCDKSSSQILAPGLDVSFARSVFHDKTKATHDAPSSSVEICDNGELASRCMHSFQPVDCFHADSTEQITNELLSCYDQNVADRTVFEDVSDGQASATSSITLGVTGVCQSTSDVVDPEDLKHCQAERCQNSPNENHSDVELTYQLVSGEDTLGVNYDASAERTSCVRQSNHDDISSGFENGHGDHVVTAMVSNGQDRNSSTEEIISVNNLEHFGTVLSEQVTSSNNCGESSKISDTDRNTIAVRSTEAAGDIYDDVIKLNDGTHLFHSYDIASGIPNNSVISSKNEKDLVCLDTSMFNQPLEYHENSEMLDLTYVPPPTNPPPLTVQEVLSLDLNLESITRYQAKPRSMYTFLCAQNLRRDEYTWHFKNIHSEIHGGLNGWIEARCPLACYGCTYSIRRLNPEGGTLVYNTDVDNFGVHPDSWHCAPHLGTSDRDPSAIQKEGIQKEGMYPSGQCVVNDSSNIDPKLCSYATQAIATGSITHGSNTSAECNGSVPHLSSANAVISNYDNETKLPFSTDGSDARSREFDQGKSSSSDKNILSTLPFEVLRYIARCLDSFSLCNLSMTCFYLREVCKSIVEDRGIVVQEWQKKQVECGFTWQVTYQRWFFSSAFTPVSRWNFVDTPNLSEHLKVCQFNVTAEARKQPFRLCFVADQILKNPEAAKTLQKMYPEFDAESEDVKTIPPNPDENLYINGIGQNGYSEYNRVLKAFAHAHI